MPYVRIRDLGIRFGLERQKHRSLRRAMLHPLQREPRRQFWAIRHIDLDLHEGDILGITGPNGAGKSTLLRSITGIYAPDEGEIEIQGRVSLLSIGAGFVPDLTGIENVYLNGAVFGFTQEEIEALIPKVRSFSGIGDFIEQPVRTYSSGMVSRLGFSVAMHLDPDILLIDEVLAVGDAAFRRKCETAVREHICKPGRIVVIVSHSPEIIASMCNRTMHLSRPEVPS